MLVTTEMAPALTNVESQFDGTATHNIFKADYTLPGAGSGCELQTPSSGSYQDAWDQTASVRYDRQLASNDGMGLQWGGLLVSQNRFLAAAAAALCVRTERTRPQ